MKTRKNFLKEFERYFSVEPVEVYKALGWSRQRYWKAKKEFSELGSPWYVRLLKVVTSKNRDEDDFFRFLDTFVRDELVYRKQIRARK